MLISVKNKFSFIHIPKTAGTSVMNELALLDKERLRPTRVQVNQKNKREYTQILGLLAPTGGAGVNLNQCYEKGVKFLEFDQSFDYPHLYYPYNVFLGEEYFGKDYFSAAFVRNPFDRLVSAFLYSKKRKEFEGSELNVNKDAEKHEDFNDFCVHYLNQEDLFHPVTRYNIHYLPQYRFLCKPLDIARNTGEVFVSFVGRFEKLKEDFNFIYRHLDPYGEVPELRHSRNLKRKRHYSEYYSTEAKKIVEKVYEKDLDIFKYTF
jgi:hypothetical protein